jgi:L1 cell adhesion molecule like protein
MAAKYKDYYIGIDYGTSFSCVGIYMNGTVEIVPNKIGERTTPSIVCFTDENKDKAIVGEETLNQKIDNYKNTIYEVKRFIGLSYEDFIEDGYDKNLNYDVVNDNGIPKIKININGQDYYYSATEISSFIIKKMVECAEDFIDKQGEGIKLTKAIITVPAHFRDNQKEAVKAAAKLAGIEVPRLIHEPTAAALAYGIGYNLVPENSNTKIKKNNTLIITKGGDDSDVAPLAIEKNKSKSKENAIVFDLGGGTLDITLLNISKNKEGIINFDVLSSDGDTHLGGSDFDNKLIDYCIQEFCKDTSIKIEDVKQDKKACKRLKIKCENAKKFLSISNETIINIDNFYGNEDLVIKMTRDRFNDLCRDIYERIQELISDILCDLGKDPLEIDEIILVGGATRMPGIKDLLKRIFGDEKVKDNLNPDEAVAFGATMEAAKMGENDKINFNLQDINAYNIGIAVHNPDKDDLEKNGLLMNSIIKKYSKIPSSFEKVFKVELRKENTTLSIKIYEGNEKYVNKNTLLGEMSLGELGMIGEIEYKVKFSIDVNSQLTALITVDSLGKQKEEIIKKVTHGFKDNNKKKIKICKSKEFKSMNVLMDSIKSTKLKLSEIVDIKSKLNNLNECCQCYEELIENYLKFIKDNESVYEKVYLSVKDLFSSYIEIIKLSGQDKSVQDIIQKIKKYMENLIPSVAYLEDLLEMFVEIKQIDNLKNVFYEIFVNFMELMNKEGKSKMEYKKFCRYYCKLYFEREFYSCKKYIKEDDILRMDKKIKEKFEEQRKINEENLNKVNSFAFFIEQKIKSGKFIYGGTGFTSIGKKIEQYEKDDITDMSDDDIREILDIFEGMLDSFDQRENSIAVAYCLSHIIIINYKRFKRGYEKLWNYINRLKAILFSKPEIKYDWITEAKNVIE